MSRLFSGQKPLEIASPCLVELANRNGIPCQEKIDARILLNLIRHAWLCKTNPLEIPQEPATPDDLRLLAELGMTNEIKPPKTGNGFEGTILLGGYLKDIQKCTSFIRDQSKAGIETGTIYVLTRYHLPVHDSVTHPTEMEIEQSIWGKAMGLHGIYPKFVSTPLEHENGSMLLRIPTTVKMVQKFIHSKPGTGTWLVVTSQPFVTLEYQNVLEGVDLEDASDNYTFMEAGPAADPELPLATYLDEVTRLLIQSLK